jgi:hypothetical protein
VPSGVDDTFTAMDAWHLLDSEAGAPLLDAAIEAGEPTPALIKQLRRAWPVPAVAAALELARARRRSGTKFPGHPELWCDVTGLEQASSRCTADWKQRRFARCGATQIADLCSGIGGDTMSLVREAEVLAVDLDPVRAWMAGRNADCRHLVADVRSADDLPQHVHIDPARRDGATGRRAWNPDAYQPTISEVLALLERSRGAGCKLGPGIPLPLPDRPAGSELEFLQEGNRLVQAVLWTGDLAEHPDHRTATLLPSGETISGVPVDSPLGDDLPAEGDWLLEPAPALERAGLVGAVLETVGGAPCELAPGLGLLHGAEAAGSPWFDDWRIEAVLPLRERPIKAWLRSHDAGEVVVRTRGGAIEVDRWTRLLRGDGANPFVVFGLRLGMTTRAIVTQPAG